MSAVCSQAHIFFENPDYFPNFFKNSTTHIINIMSIILSELISETGKNFQPNPSVFNCKSPPKISIKKYLERFDLYAHSSQECFVLALIYMDRITEQNTQFVITPLNIHRLLITSFVVAAKFFDEEYFPNSFYAKIGGISLQDMNKLEVEFLKLIDYKLFVDDEIFNQYKEKMINCEQ